MDDKKFKRLQKSMKQALHHAQGKDGKVTMTEIRILEPKVMSAKQIAALRTKLRLSQSVFAKLLNVSPKTVMAWEQGQNPPNGCSLRMLEMIENDPERFLRMSEDDGIIERLEA
jgi:putative transcriptional regulator